MARQYYSVVANDWINLEAVINDLSSRVTSQELFPTSSPTFAGVSLTTLTVTNCAVLGNNSAVFQPGADSTTFWQILDADGGTPVVNVDTTNERVGIGTATPNNSIQVVGLVNLEAYPAILLPREIKMSASDIRACEELLKAAVT